MAANNCTNKYVIGNKKKATVHHGKLVQQFTCETIPIGPKHPRRKSLTRKEGAVSRFTTARETLNCK